MKCPKCNSENVQVQSKEYKPKLTVPILMVGGGFGLVFGGIGGCVLGLIIGAVVAGVVHSVIPQTYQSVLVCQQCGFVGVVPTIANADPNSLFCTIDECNLMVARSSDNTGSLCTLRVRIDTYAPFDLINGDVKFLRLEPGVHRISYFQVNGVGKNKRRGLLAVNIGEGRRLVQFDFIPNGLDVLNIVYAKEDL
jgi:hypothetical protein